MNEDHGSVGRRGIGETTSPDNQKCIFPTVLFLCVKTWDTTFQSATYKALYWTLLRHCPGCFTPTANLRRHFAWWHLAAQLCPQVDLWAVKHGQINTLSIPDRIRRSETRQHSHTSLMPCTISVSPQPSGVGFREGSRRWHPRPSPSWQYKGSWGDFRCYLAFKVL